MSATDHPIVQILVSRFSDIDFAPAPLMVRRDASKEQTYVRVPSDRLVELMRFLHDDERCRFEQLCDLTCIDYMKFPKARDRYCAI